MTTDHPRWVVVDDTDVNIQYSGPWFQDQGSQDTVGNFGPAYESTMHGTKSNASLSYSFSGTQVQIIGSNNLRNDSGVLDPTWECFIDKIRIPPTTPFQFPENNWVFCEQDQLVDGPHVITVNATVLKAQTFWFDSIHYVPSPSLPLDRAAVLVDSLDPALQFGDGWGPLGGTANLTGKTNSIFTFDFIGVSLSWYAFIPTELPHAATTSSYSIDGGPPTNFLLKGLAPTEGTIYNQKFFETTVLPAGHHQIVVTYLGNGQSTPLALDYLIVQNGTIPSNTTSGTSPSGDTGPTSTKKSGNIGAIAGGVVGGLLLIAIAIAAYVYFRRREQRLNEKVDLTESNPPFVEPFHYSPVQTSGLQNSNPALVTLTYQGHRPQLSGETYPTTHHSSRPSYSNTDPLSNIPPSTSSGASFPSNINSPGYQPRSPPVNQGYLTSTTPLTDKARREAEATASILRSQGHQQTTTPSVDDSSSRLVMHEDSGIRMPATGEHTNVVEVPPMYTPG